MTLLRLSNTQLLAILNQSLSANRRVFKKLLEPRLNSLQLMTRSTLFELTELTNLLMNMLLLVGSNGLLLQLNKLGMLLTDFLFMMMLLFKMSKTMVTEL